MIRTLRHVMISSTYPIPVWRNRGMHLDMTNHQFKLNTHDMIIVLDVFGGFATVLTKFGVGYMITVWINVYFD